MTSKFSFKIKILLENILNTYNSYYKVFERDFFDQGLISAEFEKKLENDDFKHEVRKAIGELKSTSDVTKSKVSFGENEEYLISI